MLSYDGLRQTSGELVPKMSACETSREIVRRVGVL